MTSIVCVKDVAEARKYAKLSPNYIAIEPPEVLLVQEKQFQLRDQN